MLFLESIYTFGLNDIEKEEVMKLAVSLTTQKAAELGVVQYLQDGIWAAMNGMSMCLHRSMCTSQNPKTDGSIWTLWVERHIPQQKRSM